MSEHAKHPLCAALALLSMMLAAVPARAGGEFQSSAGGLHYGIGGPSSTACQAGKPPAPGDWIEANGIAVESGDTRRMSLSFGEGLATSAYRVAMNDAAARHLALVEVQDGGGAWHKAWEGKLAALSPNFASTCFEQPLQGKQVVQALRFTFRQGGGDVQVDHAALLRR
jgi:hypothetical protein